MLSLIQIFIIGFIYACHILYSDKKENVTETNSEHKDGHNHVELAGNVTNLYQEEDNSFGDEEVTNTYSDDYKENEENTRGDVGDPLEGDSGGTVNPLEDDDYYY